MKPIRIKLSIVSILIFAILQNGVVVIAKAQTPLRKINAFREITPRKLGIQAVIDQKTALHAGSRLKFVVTLLDNNNRELTTHANVTVEITFTTDERNFDRQRITIPAGSSRSTITYVPGGDKSGALHVRAVNRELLEGSTFVKLLPGPPPGASIKRPSGNNSIFHFASFNPDPEYPFINVIIDKREYLADGIDEADVTVSFEDPDHKLNADSVFVFANTDGGKILQPDGLYINRIAMKKFRLVSKKKGIIRPRINVHNINIAVTNNDQEIKFVPPIDFFKITAGPSDIHLLNRSKIIVTLFDRDTVPVETDKDMSINLSLVEGDGSLLPDTSLVIKHGSSETSGFFMPNAAGQVVIAGRIPSLANQIIDKPIHVSWPVMIIIVIFGGGIVGSLAFLLYGKIKGVKNWLTRIAAGIISGIVIYLLYVTGIYKDIFVQSNINLAVVALVAVAGGYLGEDVMVALADKIKGALNLLKSKLT